MAVNEPTAEDQAVLEKAEELVKYLSGGGTLGALAGLGGEEKEAIYAVAYNYFSAQKYDKAMDLFKFLCLNDHLEPRWYYSLGVACQKKGDYAAAVNAYAVATLLDVDDPRPQAQAGYCLMAQGKWPEAEAALEGALQVCAERPGHDDVKTQSESLLGTVKARNAGKGD